jgi:hypothetical protein
MRPTQSAGAELSPDDQGRRCSRALAEQGEVARAITWNPRAKLGSGQREAQQRASRTTALRLALVYARAAAVGRSSFNAGRFEPEGLVLDRACGGFAETEAEVARLPLHRAAPAGRAQWRFVEPVPEA